MIKYQIHMSADMCSNRKKRNNPHFRGIGKTTFLKETYVYFKLYYKRNINAKFNQ
jgi:hypothetical protein